MHRSGIKFQCLIGSNAAGWLRKHGTDYERRFLANLFCQGGGRFIEVRGGILHAKADFKGAVILTNDDHLKRLLAHKHGLALDDFYTQRLSANGKQIRAAVLGSKPVPALELWKAVAALASSAPMPSIPKSNDVNGAPQVLAPQS